MTNRQNWSWAYQLLPYMEQDNLWRTTSDTVVMGTTVPIYFCPSRRSPMVVSEFPSLPPQNPNVPRAQIDYAGNTGTDWPLPNSILADGMFASNNRPAIGFQAILDGLSNTLLVAEKRLTGRVGMGQWDDNEGFVAGFDVDTLRSCLRVPSRDQVITPIGDLSSISDFGSAHPTGMNAVFADGSVRWVRYGGSLAMFQAACRKADGVTLNLDDL